MKSIEEARKQIEGIDKQLIDLFKERMNAVKDVIEYKKANNLPILDASREKELLDKNLKYLNDESLKKYYEIFFEGLLRASKEYQGEEK